MRPPSTTLQRLRRTHQRPPRQSIDLRDDSGGQRRCRSSAIRTSACTTSKQWPARPYRSGVRWRTCPTVMVFMVSSSRSLGSGCQRCCCCFRSPSKVRPTVIPERSRTSLGLLYAPSTEPPTPYDPCPLWCRKVRPEPASLIEDTPKHSGGWPSERCHFRMTPLRPDCIAKRVSGSVSSHFPFAARGRIQVTRALSGEVLHASCGVVGVLPLELRFRRRVPRPCVCRPVEQRNEVVFCCVSW